MEVVRIVAHSISDNQLSSIIKMRDELDSIIKQIRGEEDAFLTPEIIISKFAEAVKEKPELLTSKVRNFHIVHKRRMLMKLLRDLLMMTYEEIGNLFGLKKGTTATGIRVISEEIEQIEGLKNFYKKIKNDIRL